MKMVSAWRIRIHRLSALLVAVACLLVGQVVAAQESSTADKDLAAQSGADDGDQSGIDVDVTVGVQRKLTPIAIADAKEPGGETGTVADTVTDTIRRDLRLSGFFKILPNDSFFFDTDKEGMGASAIKFQNWFNVGAQGLIKSAVRTNGDQVVLDLRLYLVDKGQRATVEWTGGSVAKDDYLDKVHSFANAVLEFYTGKPGVFGSKIAYVQRKGRSKQIYTMQMDGTHRARITHNNSINMLPSFGNGRLYYTSYKAGNPDLWVYQGGKHRKLSSKPGQNTGAAYCGGSLAVTLSKGGENTDIYLIDADTGNIDKRLTKHWSIDTSPTWSPDCSKIAFVSGRSGGPQIYVMNADGSARKRLTYQGSYNTQPDWSPDGKVVVFSARDERSAFDIFTVDLEGHIERLTQDQGNNSDPSFSPDGRWVVFVSDRGGKGKRVWMMTADGEVQNQLTDGSGYQSPAWQK